jgi:hypothetical protein
MERQMAGSSTSGANSREGLVQRLFEAFATQVRDIEARVARAGETEIVEDTKTLGGLARTLETLISLDEKVSGQGRERSLDIDAVRAELADRLSRLKRAKGPKRAGAAAAKT